MRHVLTSTDKQVLEYWKNKLSWEDLDFHVEGRLVLRHNKNLQYGYTIKENETLGEALRGMEKYCKEHPHGNPKITGFIKVVEHTKLNNVPLFIKLKPKVFPVLYTQEED
jgi:hypothetical protein